VISKKKGREPAAHQAEKRDKQQKENLGDRERTLHRCPKRNAPARHKKKEIKNSKRTKRKKTFSSNMNQDRGCHAPQEGYFLTLPGEKKN